MERRGKKRQQKNDPPPTPVSTKRTRKSRQASHTVTSTLPSNDEGITSTVPRTSTGIQSIVDHISSAIMSQVETTIRREVAGQLRTLGLELNSVSDSQTTGVAAVTGIQTSSVNVVPAIQTTTVNSVPAITTTGQTSQGGMSVAHMSGTVVSNTNLVAAQITSPIMSTKVSGITAASVFDTCIGHCTHSRPEPTQISIYVSCFAFACYCKSEG